MTAEEILAIVDQQNVRFMRLFFSDITGMNKNVEVPRSQFETALRGEVLFDGSSIEGFSRIEESDMVLKPDLDTFRILPWDIGNGRAARLICDSYMPDGTPFEGCPRLILKRQVDYARSLGFEPMMGPEAEFFLFRREANGALTRVTADQAGYFDLGPLDRGEDARRAIVVALEQMGFEIEAAHHEVAPGQHEIDFKYAPAVACADQLSTFRFVVRKVAMDFDLHATFMPKPIHGINGSGMHVHQSLFRGSANAFFDASAPRQLSKVARGYIAGILKHARSFCAITNPIVNSYKRLVPGYEAPTQISWSERNRSPLCRIPGRRGLGTRVEVRNPDPASNPYLAFAVMLRAGLDGIVQGLEPGEPVARNLYEMTPDELHAAGIRSLPGDLNEALAELEASALMREVLGEHVFAAFLKAKRTEWQEYIAQVHAWEVDRYLAVL